MKKKTKYLNAVVQLNNKLLKRTKSQNVCMKLKAEKTNTNFKKNLKTRNNGLNNEIGRLQVKIQQEIEKKRKMKGMKMSTCGY